MVRIKIKPMVEKSDTKFCMNKGERNRFKSPNPEKLKFGVLNTKEMYNHNLWPQTLKLKYVQLRKMNDTHLREP